MEYPCENCPGALLPANESAWSIFASAASRGTHKVNKIDVDYFEIDWSLVRLLLEVHETEGPAETVQKILSLLRALNA